MPSRLRRRRCLQSLRSRPHSGNANGFSAGKLRARRWPVLAEPSIAVVRKAGFCIVLSLNDEYKGQWKPRATRSNIGCYFKTFMVRFACLVAAKRFMI
jgi:hypothetical protein